MSRAHEMERKESEDLAGRIKALLPDMGNVIFNSGELICPEDGGYYFDPDRLCKRCLEKFRRYYYGKFSRETEK